jgi:hypothetical protein
MQMHPRIVEDSPRPDDRSPAVNEVASRALDAAAESELQK